ncbi:uncharacterized protein LOC110024462 isoform X2 [Phalaenopsis equestris]|uniref:uncharacterized protein LOC110024462 isoform X2 n=1 Tax=Phalaenopsis equestris TaxID=78828 RepID=UPI0009E6100D|nr:uncharacterized protein LOC110024462 isoform X2 [Phalaenopsis equestris]
MLACLPRDFDGSFLRFSRRCTHTRLGFLQGPILSNERTLINHSSVHGPLTLGHRSRYNSTISSKFESPGFNRGGFLFSVSTGSGSADTNSRPSDENPRSFESLEEFSGLKSSFRGERERGGNGAPLLTTFDFLELKRELEKEENARAGSMEEGSRPDNLEETTSSSEREEIVVGSTGVRGGRRVMRRSNLLAKQWVVALVEVRPNFLSGDAEKFLLEDVYQVGDVVLVPDESVMQDELKMTGLDTLVGYDVVKDGRRSIGKIRGYTFSINSGAVESLEFDSFGFSIIPSSLVSTYQLSVEDVLDVESDKVIVYEEDFSHIQRLTKGIWDSGKIGRSGDHLEGRHDFRRKSSFADRRRSRQSSGSPKFPHGDDEWDLPLDY